MSNNFEEIKKQVKEKISEITEISVDKLEEGARFVEDLGVDSMLALEIIASIEKLYRLKVPEEEIPKIRTVGDVYSLVKKLMNL